MSKIAIIDVETTGLDPRFHEIIEMGMVVFDSRTFEILDTFEAKVKPEWIDRAHFKALEVNGYNEEEWKDGMTLYQMMNFLYERTQDTIFCAHNMIFDWGFLDEAQRQTGITLPFGRHKIDLLTLAWGKIPHHKVSSWSLKTVCTYLGIPPEPKMHRALNGAMAEYEVYKALMSGSNVALKGT